MRWYHWDGEDLVLHVDVQPRSSREGFSRRRGDRFRLQVSAPPVDGQANQRLTRMLGKAFGVSRSSVMLEQGGKSRQKRFRICAPTRIPAEISADGEFEGAP